MLKSRWRGWREGDIWQSQSQNLWSSEVSEAQGAVDCLLNLHSTLLLVGDVGTLNLMRGRFPCSRDSEWELGLADYTCLRLDLEGRCEVEAVSLSFLGRLSFSSTAVCFLQAPGYWEAVAEAEQLWGLPDSGLLVPGLQLWERVWNA